MAGPIPAEKAPYGIDVEPGKACFWFAGGRGRGTSFCGGTCVHPG